MPFGFYKRRFEFNCECKFNFVWNLFYLLLMMFEVNWIFDLVTTYIFKPSLTNKRTINYVINKTNKMHFVYIFYSENLLYMFRTDKLFVLRRHFSLYVRILVCILLLAASHRWYKIHTNICTYSEKCLLRTNNNSVRNM